MFTSHRRQWRTHGRAVTTMFVYEMWTVIIVAVLVMGGPTLYYGTK